VRLPHFLSNRWCLRPKHARAKEPVAEREDESQDEESDCHEDSDPRTSSSLPRPDPDAPNQVLEGYYIAVNMLVVGEEFDPKLPCSLSPSPVWDVFYADLRAKMLEG